MSPLQRETLRFLAVQNRGVLLDDIARAVSDALKRHVEARSIGGAFSRNRIWLFSESGKLNEHSSITISAEGREALAAYDAHREATHPMGPQTPGRFFVFIKEVKTITYHAMVVRNVADQAEAEAQARAQCEEGMLPSMATLSTERTYKVRPVRDGHGI